MKKLRIFSVLLILVMLTVPVCADILWEPFDNDYYRRHMDEASGYHAVGVVPEGSSANVYRNPETGGLLAELEGGDRFYIGPVIDIDGELWGAGYVCADSGTEGWVRVNRLIKEYDNGDFETEFGSTFVTTDDRLTAEDVNGDILVWTYPGSGVCERTIPADVLDGDYNNGGMDFIHVYTDPEGGRWGYVGYYMGRCSWVWLDDPANPEPPYRLDPTQTGTPADTSEEEAPGGNGLIWICAGAAVLVIATAAAIAVLKKKSKK